MPIKGIKGGVGTKALGYGLGAAAEEATDPNFNQTVLLLHADGSEGAGNTAALGSPNYKAFRDNSTSAHALAVAGDAYGNDFSPYYYADGYWSVSFADATSDDDIEFAGAIITLDGEFCFECFYSNLDFGSTDIIFSSDVNDEFQVYINSSEQFGFNFGGSSSAKFLVASGTSLGVYNHFVVTRDSSNNVRGFVNGVLKA